jgi:hypothetical protein
MALSSRSSPKNNLRSLRASTPPPWMRSVKPSIVSVSSPPRWLRENSGDYRSYQQSRLATLRRSALWYERWLRLLAEKYEVPITSLERLDPDALSYEIAWMLAESVLREARDLASEGGTKEEVRDRMRKRVKMKSSKDWFDKLVCERWHLEKQQNTVNS